MDSMKGNGAGIPPGGQLVGQRPTSQDLIREMIQIYQVRIASLEKLLKELPDLSPDADTAFVALMTNQGI